MAQERDDHGNQCGPLGSSRPVWVDVYAHKDKKGDITFCHEWRLKEHGPGDGKGPIEVPKGTPESPIRFDLHDQTERGLKFFEDSIDAFWAERDHCPGGKGDGGGQIKFPEAKTQANGKKLRVDNTNSEECELHFALRFKDSQNNVEKYDPVIRNKGGVP